MPHGILGAGVGYKLYNRSVYDVALAVTASDTTDLSGGPYTAIVAEGGGVITVDMIEGATNVAVPVAAGVLMPIMITRVYETGTTATAGAITALKHKQDSIY